MARRLQGNLKEIAGGQRPEFEKKKKKFGLQILLFVGPTLRAN